MKKLGPIIACLALLVCDPGTLWGAPLSEAAYLALVLERNRDLEALRTEIEARIFSARAEVASQRPALALTAEESQWLNQDRGDRLLDLAVSHRMDLSGRYGLQERELLLGVEILRSRYADSVNETLARATEAYRRAVMAALNRDAMTRILERRRESLEVTREKYDQEMVPHLDLLRAQSQVDDGEALLLQALRTYDQELLAMAAFAGQIPVCPLAALPESPDRNPAVDLERAWEARPDVAALRLGEARASVVRTLAARGMAPFLDLSLGWRLGEDYRSPFVEREQGEVRARLALTVPLADGKKTENALRAGTLLVEKARQELEARRHTLRREVDMVRERWIRALDLEVLRRRQAARATEELEIAEMMYREGLASQLDLINAQEGDQRSRSDHLGAIQELWLIQAEGDRVMGRYLSKKTTEALRTAVGAGVGIP